MVLTDTKKPSILDITFKKFIKFPCSRGDSGALNLQSATAGVMFCLGSIFVGLPSISDVDVWVLRNRNL